MVIDMHYVTGTAAPTLAADAFVRGQKRFSLALSEYRDTWAVVAYAPRHADVLELAQLEEAFGADGAIVLATTLHDWHDTADRYGDEPVRFPLFTEVAEQRRITIIVDPGGAPPRTLQVPSDQSVNALRSDGRTLYLFGASHTILTYPVP